jgi:hypothetical protein
MTVYTLGVQERGQEIAVGSTRDLAPGDLLVIRFPFGARGWLKYGGEEVFTVTAVDPATGDVQAVDEGGGGLALPGGSRQELEARLSELTSFSSITVFRPSLAPLEQDLGPKGLGLPAGYEPIEPAAWGELAPGDYVYAGLGVPYLERVESVDADLVVARIMGTEDWSKVGELAYHQPQDGFWETDLVYRRSFLAQAARSWLLPSAAAGTLLAVLLFS